MVLSDDKLWDLWNAQGTDDMSQAEAFVFARAIETEVRKQDTELIRQMREALESCNNSDGYNGPYQYHDDKAVESAIAAANARLEGKL